MHIFCSFEVVGRKKETWYWETPEQYLPLVWQEVVIMTLRCSSCGKETYKVISGNRGFFSASIPANGVLQKTKMYYDRGGTVQMNLKKNRDNFLLTNHR